MDEGPGERVESSSELTQPASLELKVSFFYEKKIIFDRYIDTKLDIYFHEHVRIVT